MNYDENKVILNRHKIILILNVIGQRELFYCENIRFYRFMVFDCISKINFFVKDLVSSAVDMCGVKGVLVYF